MAPDATNLLLEAIDRAFDMKSWHGANLSGALRGLSPADAAVRFAGRKSIWEQLLHAAYWKHRVVSRLSGGDAPPFPRRGSDWPAAPSDPSTRRWREDVRMLRDVHRQLRALVASLPADRLDAKTTWLIHGTAAHDVYHAGQIKLLRRLLSSKCRPSMQRAR